MNSNAQVKPTRPWVADGGLVWTIFSLALCIRLAYAWETRDNPVFQVFLLDAEYYLNQAWRILEGDWLSGNAVFAMSPFYPYYLALWLGLFDHSTTAVKLIQHLIGASTAAIICRIGLQLGGTVCGAVAGLIAATYGIFLFAESTFENEFLVIFFNTFAMWRLLRVREHAARPNAALAGLSIGLSAIIRPNALLLAVPSLIWLRRIARDQTSSWKQTVALFSAAVLLPVSLTAVRNYSVSGERVLITATGGEVFYIGTLPGGNGGYVAPPFISPRPDREHEDFRREASRRAGRELTLSESSGFWLAEGLRRITRRPAAHARLLLKKTQAFLNVDEPPDNAHYGFGRAMSRVLALPWPGIGLILPLAALGIAVTWKDRNWLLPTGWLAVYYLNILLFYQSYRFRLPATPSLILLSGAAAAWALHQMTAGKLKRLIPACLLVLAFVAASRSPLPQADFRLDDAEVAVKYAVVINRIGMSEEAVEVLQTMMRKDPETARLVIEELLRKIGHPPESVANPDGG